MGSMFVQAQAQVCLLWSLSRLSFAPAFLRQLMTVTASSVADFSGGMKKNGEKSMGYGEMGGKMVWVFIIKLTNQMSNIESSFIFCWRFDARKKLEKKMKYHNSKLSGIEIVRTLKVCPFQTF